MRRSTRLTNGFSKKIENRTHAVSSPNCSTLGKVALLATDQSLDFPCKGVVDPDPRPAIAGSPHPIGKQEVNVDAVLQHGPLHPDVVAEPTLGRPALVREDGRGRKARRHNAPVSPIAPLSKKVEAVTGLNPRVGWPR